MDVIEQLQEDLRNGRVDPQRLIDLIRLVQRELQTARQRITDLEQRNAELEKQLAAASGTAKLAEPFSLRAEE
jgi:cell division septum initiation protein DivIVA